LPPELSQLNAIDDDLYFPIYTHSGALELDYIHGIIMPEV
jgi:hypothetical protein